MTIANSFERQMLDLINAERAAVGLDALRLNVLLNDSSEDHSQWMLENDAFSHTGAGGSSSHDRMNAADYPFEGVWASGENIAVQSERGPAGIADDVIQLHEALMASPGHRANILNPNYTEIGIGIEQGDFRGFDAIMVTQNFASTQGDTTGSVEPDPTPEPEPVPDPTPVDDEPSQNWCGAYTADDAVKDTFSFVVDESTTETARAVFDELDVLPEWVEPFAASISSGESTTLDAPYAQDADSAGQPALVDDWF